MYQLFTSSGLLFTSYSGRSGRVTKRESFSKVFWATVCKTVHPMLSDPCPVCLFVCDVRALWPNGWTTKMKLGMQVGLSPGHIVLDGDPATPPQRGTAPQFSAHICRGQNGCMDQDATWYGDRRRPRRLCVIWGPRSPSPKGEQSPPNFRPMFIGAKQLDRSRWYLART